MTPGGVSRFVHAMDSHGTGRERPLTVFSGDVFAPSMLSTITKGRHMIPFLNMMGIDVACLGNHGTACLPNRSPQHTAVIGSIARGTKQ